MSKFSYVIIILFLSFVLFGGCIMSEGKQDNSCYIGGEIIVGFEKDISYKDAAGVLEKYNLRFEEAVDVNVSKGFCYATGEKFLVFVENGQEDYWINILEKENKIKKIIRHTNRDKMIID